MEENNSIIKCTKCDRTLIPQVLTFNCSHHFCPSCFAYNFFKSPLSNIFINEDREMVIDCPCDKGKIKVNLEEVANYLDKNQIKAPPCNNHKEQCTSYCSKCKLWLCKSCLSLFHNTYFSDHTLSSVSLPTKDILCEKHNKKFKAKCMTCKAHICSNCLIDEHLEHNVVNYKEMIKSRLKFPTFDAYDDYLTKKEIQLKDELNFTNKEITQKLETTIKYLTSTKDKMIQNYNSNCRYITDLNNFNRKLYHYLYEKIASNDPNINPLLDMTGNDVVYIDIGLKHYPQKKYDSLFRIAEDLSRNRVDCTIKLVYLQLFCQKSFMSVKKQHVNAICQVKSNIIAIGAVKKNLELVDLSDLENLQCILLEAHTDGITELLSRYDGDLISCSLDCQIKMWQIDSLQEIQLVKTLTGHKDGINTMICLPNNRIASGAKDNNIKLWDLKEMKYIKTMSNHKKEINRMINVTKTQMCSSSLDMTMCVWNVDKGTCEFVVPLSRGLITCMFIYGEALYTGMEKDNAIIKWSIGNLTMESGIRQHEGLVTQSICLSNGQIASSSIDQTIAIWDMNKSKCTGILVGHRTEIHALTELADGRIVSGSDEGVIKIWTFI